MKKYVWLILFFFTIISCTPVEKAEETAEILNDGVDGTVEFSVVGNLDRGEFLLGGLGDEILIRVKNNTGYNLSDAQLLIDQASSAGVKFFPDEAGESESPGFGGDCGLIIASKATCYYKLRYEARTSGIHTQDLQFNYKTLIDNFSQSTQLKFLTGTPASLVFEEETINYSFGVVERTEPKVFSQRLVVVNTGELRARNITMTKLDNTTSNAISIVSNTCGTVLLQNETCELVVEFEAKNYGVGAPDGNVDVDYNSNIRFDYGRDPEGGINALNVYFDAKSIRIEGDIQIGGLPNLSFDDLVVGNIDTQTLKVSNKGYKEAIVLSVDVRNASNTLVARCLRDDSTGGDNLVCRDPAGDLTSSASDLPLTTIPFKFFDTSKCFIDVNDFNYIRGEDGRITNTALKQVAGRTIADPGGSCFFNVTFHPSVQFEADGNFNNYRFNVRYDSTWKDNVVIKNDLDSDENNYVVEDANYLAAAKLSFDVIEYKNGIYNNLDTADNDLFDYDLGRISLIANSNYKERLRIRVNNSGSTFGEVVSVTDGAQPTANVITETSYHINNYYQNVKNSGCGFLNPYNGQCDILFDLNPIVSTNPDSTAAENEENSAMYDVLNAYPERYKIFRIKYKDGTTYNDDMSPRTDREIEMKMRGLLVRKGFLAFSDFAMTDGITYSPVTANETRYFHLKLENVGTGGITYIDFSAPGFYPGVPFWAPSPGMPLFGGEIVDNPSSALVAGVDKDCYDFMDFGGMTGPASTPAGTNAPSLLSPGEVCSLTIELEKLSNDKREDSYYNTNDRRWQRHFSAPLNGSHALREYTSGMMIQDFFIFDYFDGDGIADAATGYTPDLDGHGGFYTTQAYPIAINSRRSAALVPEGAQPMISAILWRQQVNIPSHSPQAGEWGQSFGSYTIPAMYRDLAKGTAAEPISYAPTKSINRIAPYRDTTYDYVYYAGTFYAGETVALPFQLYNAGERQASSLVQMLNGDSEFAVTTMPGTVGQASLANIELSFAPATQGTFQTELEVQYRDGSQTLVDRDTYAYTDNIKSLRILVVAEAVPANTGRLSLKSQKYTVEYDELTSSHTETLDPAQTNHNLVMNDYDAATTVGVEAVRGSNVYAKTRLVFTNEGTTTVNNVKFNLKTSLLGAIHDNNGAGVGYSLESVNCGATLAPGASCFADVKHKASIAELPITTRYGIVSYDIGTDQYYAESFRIQFTAVDPAKVAAGNLITNNISDGSGGTIPNAYFIDIGTYTNPAHPILSAYPSGSLIKNINLNNPSDEKASFLKEYREFVGNQSATIPAGDFHTIYNQGFIQVELNRPCFFGDDEGGALPEEEWGFNVNTTSTCTMRVTFTFDDTYLGQYVDESENYAILKYYDSKRASVSTLPIYVKGFIEPNRSNAMTNEIFNVETDDTGRVYLEWVDFAPINNDWGPIISYRVYYSEFESSLSDLYNSTGLTFVETAGMTPNVEITGLLQNRFYYLRVVAVRETSSGKQYISMPNGFSTKEVVVPDESAIYDYSRGFIIDKFALPEGSGSPTFITKSEAIENCEGATRTIRKNGGNRSRAKELINLNDYYLINADDTNSDYPFFAFPHWLADAPEDIAPLFPGFSCDLTNMHNEDDSIMFIKSCDNCTCNTLSKIVGGEDFPLDTIIYAYDDFSGAARCRVSQDDF
ncbi:fibronectin type III domain-containing protein [Halobacteriovorax sp. CON-3]|uniref:fibronectin type III domain-containing protein n=1 Tax=Halobacteriovorax sp. CON-3 TaxID=3157710 RepID=UPI00371EF154